MPMKTAINSELGNDQSKNDVSKSAQYNTGEKYIWTALNPRYALIMNLSGATKNFRFFNEYINMIKFGDKQNPGLKYNQFSGEGSANLMTSLFPSSAGLLETGGGVDEMHPLSKCTPSPELMASIMTYLHNCVRCSDAKDKVKLSDLKGVYKNGVKVSQNFVKENFDNPTNKNSIYYFLKERLKLDYETAKSLVANTQKFSTLVYVLQNVGIMCNHLLEVRLCIL